MVLASISRANNRMNPTWLISRQNNVFTRIVVSSSGGGAHHASAKQVMRVPLDTMGGCRNRSLLVSSLVETNFTKGKEGAYDEGNDAQGRV